MVCKFLSPGANQPDFGDMASVLAERRAQRAKEEAAHREQLKREAEARKRAEREQTERELAVSLCLARGLGFPRWVFSKADLLLPSASLLLHTAHSSSRS